MKRKIISWLSLLIVFIFLGCREELDYFNEKQPQTSYNFSKENVITNILKKKDYEARPFLKPSVDFVNAYLKSQHASPVSSSAKITAADISGIDLYTDVVEEVKYGNADYYSFYVRGKDENGFEQKLVVKAVNNQVVNKYLLRYKRINGFTIDPNSYQTVKWTEADTNNGSLMSSEHTVVVNCIVYTTINYDCGEGDHHVGMVCPTSHEYVPMPILVSYLDLNCLYAGETGGSGPFSGSSGTTGSTPGNNGGSSSGSGNPDFYVDDTSDPTPPLITLPTSAPLYDIKGQITGSIKNPPDFNPLNLTPAEITLINSNSDLRLGIYQYLATNYSYPFSQGTIITQELIDYVKFVLNFFAQNPTTTWEQFQNWFLNQNSLSLDSNINGNNSIIFNNLQDFKSNLLTKNANLVIESSILQDNGSEKIVSARVQRAGVWGSGEEVRIKLKKVNNVWAFDSVTSTEYGLTLGVWSFTQLDYSQNVSSNVLTVAVTGLENYNVFLEGLGTVYKDRVMIKVKININTGNIFNIEFIDL